jgi:F0F1-type ATP synthase membrane subunit b/b'
MTSKFEQLIEYVINDEEQKARELFHDIVVEKSREIYENLMNEESDEKKSKSLKNKTTKLLSKKILPVQLAKI